MTSFREKLKEIRASEEERQRRRVPLSDRDLGIDVSSERCLVARGELVKELERMMQEFIAEAPMFEVGHGFFEGRYALSLSYDEPVFDEQRGVRKHFTRINFLLDPCTADGSFSITSKLTIRDRDLPKGSASGNLTVADDLTAFRKFGEEQMLRFATEYFAGRTRPQPPQSPQGQPQPLPVQQAT